MAIGYYRPEFVSLPVNQHGSAHNPKAAGALFGAGGAGWMPLGGELMLAVVFVSIVVVHYGFKAAEKAMVFTIGAGAEKEGVRISSAGAVTEC